MHIKAVADLLGHSFDHHRRRHLRAHVRCDHAGRCRRPDQCAWVVKATGVFSSRSRHCLCEALEQTRHERHGYHCVDDCVVRRCGLVDSDMSRQPSRCRRTTVREPIGVKVEQRQFIIRMGLNGASGSAFAGSASSACCFTCLYRLSTHSLTKDSMMLTAKACAGW